MPLRPLVVFQSAAAESVLRQNGLATLDAIFGRRADAQVRHVGRAVSKAHLCGLDGNAMTVFIKLSWGRRRWWPRLSDIRSGQVLKSMAVREWEGLAVFERLGLRVPQRLAILEEGLLWKRSALILKAVPPPASLSDMILDKSWLGLPPEDRRSILEQVARTLCRIHSASWAWRSISTRHVFPQRTNRGYWEIWLIDCEGVHAARSLKQLNRDFRRFIRALAHDNADERTLELARGIESRLPLFQASGAGESRSKHGGAAA